MSETGSDQPWCHLDYDFSERSEIKVTQKQFSIGRHPKNNLVESDERVSAYHCQLLFKDRSEGPAEVKDTSTYGTFINGKKIGKDRSKPVNEGDVVAVILGEPTLIFTFRDRRPEPKPAAAPKPVFESDGNLVLSSLPPPEESTIASQFAPASAPGSVPAHSKLSIPAPIPAVRDLEDVQGAAAPPRPPPPGAPPPPLPPAFSESDNVLLNTLPPPEESIINMRFGGSKEGDTIGYAAC